MNGFYYLLEANAYLLVFYIFYKLVLQRETFYDLNRFYLIGTGLLSFVLPIFQLSALRPQVIEQVQYSQVYIPEEALTYQSTDFWTVSNFAIAAYLFITCCFFFRLGIKLYKIIRLIRQNEYQYEQGIRKIIMPDKGVAFSFLNYLFVDPALPAMDTILRHESVHIRQKHTADVLFFELLQVINWFNPLLLFLKKEIKALHEFIADEATMEFENDAESYSMFLISHSYGTLEQNLGSQMFSGLLLKKRITRLFQQKSGKTARWKYLITVTLIIILPCLSSMTYSKAYAVIDLSTLKRIPVMTTGEDFKVLSHAAVLKGNHTENNFAEKEDKARDLATKINRVGPKHKINRKIVVRQFSVLINAVTDTLKFRTVPIKGKNPKMYKGIYVIDGKAYSNGDMKKALLKTGKMDIILPNRPIVGIATNVGEKALQKYGPQAKNGIVFVNSSRDSTTLNY